MPSPSPDSPASAARRAARRLHRKTELARSQGCARARRASRRRDRRRREREDDDAGHRRRRLRSGAEPDEADRPAGQEQQAEARRGAQRAGRCAQIRILTEEEFCRLAGVPTPDALKRQYPRDARSAGALSRAARGSPALPGEVRRHAAGPAHQRRHVLRLPRSGRDQAGERRARRRALVPRDRPRADRRAARSARVRLPARRGAGEDPHAAASEPRAQRAERRARQPAVATPRSPKNTSAPASALDDGDESKLEEAAAAYRKALELDPYLVAALINLANIHYSRDELAEAQALYERAIGLESDFFEAHFNLGQHLPRPRPLHRGAGVLPRSAAPESVLRRRAFLSGGDVREDGAVAGRAAALARRTSSSRRRASGSSWRGSFLNDG